MRYLKVTLLFGILSSLIVAALCEAGVFARPDQILSNLLGNPPVETHRSIVQYAVFVALALGIAWTTVDIPKPSLKIVVAVCALAEIVGACWVLNAFQRYFSPFAPGSAVILSALMGLVYARTAGGQRKRILRSVFGERISAEAFHTLVNSKDPVEFKGQLREASILVCEVFNHDDLLGDDGKAEPYVTALNRLLGDASDLLVEKGGYLDECDGESLRVVFGAPIADENHAVTACRAALELAQKLTDLNGHITADHGHAIDFRIGVNSGEVVTAFYGSRRLGAFSVAGDAVEFARHLCVANRTYGSRIMIGAETLSAANGKIEVRPMDFIRSAEDKGQQEIYELLGLHGTLPEEELKRRDLFWKGLVYFREQQWEPAREHFRQARPADRSDEPIQFYLQRIEGFAAGIKESEPNS